MSATKQMRAAIYARQSDPGKRGHLKTDDKTVSINTQIDAGHRTATELMAIVADTFDEQITSEVFEDRPQLNRMLGRLDRYDLIIVYKYDRIVRDPDQQNLFLRACHAKGVRVISCTEQEINYNDPISKAVGFLMGTLAQMEKIRLKERVRDAKQQILDRGLIIESGRAKYGYQYQEGKRIIDPVTSQVVERIFADIAGGLSLGQCATKLTTEGIAPPRVRWSQEGIGKIIRDPSYYGAAMVINKTQPTDKRYESGVRIRVKADGNTIGEATPSIVSCDVWQKANDNLTSNRKRGGKSRLNLWLRGHVHCEECGHAMTAHPLHKDNKYEYRCAYAHRGLTPCTRVGYPIDDVEAKVKSILDYYYSYPALLRKLVAEALPEVIDWEERARDHDRIATGLRKKLGRLTASLGDEDSRVVRDAIKAQMTTVATDIEREDSAADEARRLAGSQRSQSQILADVDELLKTKAHTDALVRFNVQVYLSACDSPRHPLAHELTPDRKGRARRLTITLFGAEMLRSATEQILDEGFLQERTSLSGRS